MTRLRQVPGERATLVAGLQVAAGAEGAVTCPGQHDDPAGSVVGSSLESRDQGRDDLIVERVSSLRAVDGDPDHVPLLFAPDNLSLAIRRQIILPSPQTHKNASAKKIPSPRVSDAFHLTTA